MMTDELNEMNPKVAIAPVVATDNTALVSNIIDTLGHRACTFVIVTGTLEDANATFAVTLEHGNDSGLSDTAVPAATDLVGTPTLAGFTFAADNACRKIGYIGGRRFVRLTITPSANTGNAPLACVAILGDALSQPTANPPV